MCKAKALDKTTGKREGEEKSKKTNPGRCDVAAFYRALIRLQAVLVDRHWALIAQDQVATVPASQAVRFIVKVTSCHLTTCCYIESPACMLIPCRSNLAKISCINTSSKRPVNFLQRGLPWSSLVLVQLLIKDRPLTCNFRGVR